MAIEFRFKPRAADVVYLDDRQGEFETSLSCATVVYEFGAGSGGVDLMLTINGQSFEAEDIDELVNFLTAARDKIIQL